MYSVKHLLFLAVMTISLIFCYNCNKGKNIFINSRKKKSELRRDTTAHKFALILEEEDYDFKKAFDKFYLALIKEEDLLDEVYWCGLNCGYLFEFGRKEISTFQPSARLQIGDLYRYEIIKLPKGISYKMAITKLSFKMQLFYVQYTRNTVCWVKPTPRKFVSCNLLNDDRTLSPAFFQCFPNWIVIYSNRETARVPIWACVINYKGDIIGLACVNAVKGGEIIVDEFHLKIKNQFDQNIFLVCHQIGHYDLLSGKRTYIEEDYGKSVNEYFFSYSVKIH